jgi:glycosyltransferase involved in cell wall biosynthesis
MRALAQGRNVGSHRSSQAARPADTRRWIVSSAAPELTVVIPVKDEGGNVPILLDRLRPVLDSCTGSWEVVFVDDGSQEETLAAIRRVHDAEPRCRAVFLSRNFGKEIAIAAGLDHARGDAVVLMDADLQHPPELIPDFVRHWRQGYQMVYGQRVDRDTDGPLRRAFTRVFYRLFAAFGEMPLPDGAGDFRLLDRKAVEALRAMGERARFSKGLYAWIGFRQIGVPFSPALRAGGSSKFTTRKLFRFAADGITSFSTVPLRLWTYVGAVVSLCAFLFTVYLILSVLVRGVDIPGYASLMVSVMFFSGVQLISLGVIGEYIGRIFAEVKRRPLYIVGERLGEEGAGRSTARPQGQDRRIA